MRIPSCAVVWIAAPTAGFAASPEIRLQSTSTAHRNSEPIRREIDLRRLKPGDYQLEVAVTTSAGRVVRRRPFTVVAGP